MNAWITGTSFVVSLLMGCYGMCYLAHRYEQRFDRMLDRWWGAPTALLGGTAGTLGFAIATTLAVQALS